MRKKFADWLKKVFEPDIVSEIRERTTNPFFISFAISWAIWNWKLLYIIFNFDEKALLVAKLVEIQKYVDTHSWRTFLFWPLLSAFLTIIATALILQISLIIVVFARRKLRPLVYKFVGHRDDIVDTATHLETKRQLQTLLDSYKDIQTENQKATTDSASLKSMLDKEKDKASMLQIEKSVNEIELKTLKNQHKLTELFEDKWHSYWIREDGSIGEESLVILGDKYMSNDRLKFNVDMIDIDREHGIIKFRKVGATDEDKRKLVNELRIINEKEYVGTENENIYIRYTHTGYGHSIEFTPVYTPIKIMVGEKSRISFKFKNNMNRPIDILSYTFSAVYNGEKYRTFQLHPYTRTLDSMQEVMIEDEFSEVNPLFEYFANKNTPGIYDSEITIDYRETGSPDILHITRIARLVVTASRMNSNIFIQSALYGANGIFNEEAAFVNEYARNNVLEFNVSNSFFENRDPIVGTLKTLDIKYFKDGVRKQVAQEEGKIIKID